MNLDLNGKLALVTRSTAGIGFAIALGLAKEGATVIINGRTKKRVNNAISQIREQLQDAKLEPLVADVSDSESVTAVTKQFPKLDILINNVGIGELKPFEKISDQDWLKLIEVNFMSGVGQAQPSGHKDRRYFTEGNEGNEEGRLWLAQHSTTLRCFVNFCKRSSVFVVLG